MEAEEPEHEASTSTPAIKDFEVVPEAVMRSSQIPVLEPEVQDQGPAYKWTEGHRLLEMQAKELRYMNDCAAGSLLFFPKRGSVGAETSQEVLVAEACDTPEHQKSEPQTLADSRARTLAPPEHGVYLVQDEWLHTTVPMATELGSRVEVEFPPNLTSSILGTEQADEQEEASPVASAQTGFWSLCKIHPIETNQTKASAAGTISQGEELQLEKAPESQGQERLLHPQEAQGLEQQEQQEREFQREGTVREGVCSDGLWWEPEQMVELTEDKEGEQRPKQEQIQDDVLGRQGGERLSGELAGLKYEWVPENREREAGGERGLEEEEQKESELRGPEECWVNSQHAENQSLAEKSEELTLKQVDQGLRGKMRPMEVQEEEAGSSKEEPGNWDRHGLGVVEEEQRAEEEEECHGPSTLAPVAPEVPSCDLFPEVSCPMTQIPGTQSESESGAGELFPRALTPTLEPTGWPSQPISPPDSFPSGESLNNKVVHDSQPEGSELGIEAKSSQGFEEVSASTSTPAPRIPDSAPSSSAEDSPFTTAISPASPPVVFPRRESPRLPLSTDNLPACGALDTHPAAVHSYPSAEVNKDRYASSNGAGPHSALANCAEAIQHLRSNSFPGSQRTEQTPDRVGMSLSFSHSELPQRPPKPAIYGSVMPRRDRRSGRNCSTISQTPPALSTPRQGSQEFTSNPQRTSSPQGSQPWDSSQDSAFATESPAYGSSPSTLSMDMRICESLIPPPPEKRHTCHSLVERDRHLPPVGPTLKQQSHPPPLALSEELHGPPKGPLPQVPDAFVARQHRPLPSTPDCSHRTQTSFSSRLRYNKPLPPTPDVSQPHLAALSSSTISRTYRPLPPVPITNPSTEPPPLPPKARGKSRSTHGGLTSSGSLAKQPSSQAWTVSTPPSAGRTSWPPATGRPTESLASTSRSKREVSPGMAFSNMTNLLCPSSPTTPWTPEFQEPSTKVEPRLSAESETSVRGPLRKSAPQQGGSGPRRSTLGPARQLEKPSHPQLEKASSWPHRRDPGRPLEASSEHVVLPGEGPSKHKSWNRQGLRRPSILPEGSSDSRGPTMGRSFGPSDIVVFREKKPKEGTGGFSRRCSKLINSSQLLYQEYSDVVWNKEIQSQQRLDSVAEAAGLASPRQPRKALVSSESYLQRLSMASSGSLWQEIPVVRNSTVLLSMTHEDQKLQEAKFELIVSEASYLRSLHIAVDHFQLSAQLRATLSNQEHQWLFSRLQDVRDVSTMFLSDLEENFENHIFSFQVCDVVLNHAADFRRVYLPYVTNQTYQERTFQSLLNSNSSFREVLEKLESDPICQRLSLKSFLILPFQRITRLKLLLQNILKRTQPGSSEEAEATKAHHVLEELIRDCNNNVQRMRRTEELIYLSQKIEFECKIFPLISQSRWLVKSGELTALEFSVSPGLRRKLNTRPVHLHLFNDCLLLSRPREGSRFLVFDHAPFSSIRGEKCEMKLHGPHKNLFRLFLRHNTQGTQSEFLFRTDTQSEKLRWISALSMPREELDLLECYDSPQVQCLRAYMPRENDELALEKADVVMVTQQSSDGWLEGIRLSDGEQGWFPLQQVEFISNPEARARNLKEAHRVKTARLQLVEQQA
ncbi:rho guanine nucleotide exchange factor 5 isoform X1 [Heterocephalus glaber]|uniref:Rho guanine nucleotide exchange factor 5 isoform X1 n=1 Tax=Heterocephalus glaber TaxID=10181 RepID=A0AAX6PUS8_HETGA|nr:rho guanine nucleotide exchange factor 5 isoform X1 [Heterocephalus glaber]XP_004860536.1 rho guanine nucleotide exchange factor 5 isoform X1 [Heterocephalus glaber]